MSTESPTTAPAPATDQAGAPPSAERRAALAQARRAWRRAGVPRAQRAALGKELAGEIEAAGADGHSPRAVLGEDLAQGARGWALERGLAGRSLQVATMLTVVLVGVVLATSTALVEVAVTFLGDSSGADTLTPGPVTLAILASSAVMAVVLPVLGTWAALAQRGDPRAGATGRWLAALLPLGAMAGLLVAVVLAAALQDHEAIAWPAMATAVLGACAGAALLARRTATRWAPIPR